MKNKIWLRLNFISFFLIITYGVIEYVVPVAAVYIWKDNYQTLMFQCDLVMREHFIAKQVVLDKPSEIAVKNLDASEVGLITCHHYDKLRKTLMAYGVSEAHLSLIGLEAVEKKSQDLRQLIEFHEIRY